MRIKTLFKNKYNSFKVQTVIKKNWVVLNYF